MGAMGERQPAVFPSRRDLWLTVILALTAVVELGAAIVVPFRSGRPSPGQAAVSVVLMAASALILWTLFGTRYIVAGDLLIIRCGPFRWKVPVASIRSLRPVLGFMSAPALSLHRLALDIRGRGGALEISPADQEAFARAVGVPLERG
jgi:hypothetical protein